MMPAQVRYEGGHELPIWIVECSECETETGRVYLTFFQGHDASHDAKLYALRHNAVCHPVTTCKFCGAPFASTEAEAHWGGKCAGYDDTTGGAK